MSKPRNGTPRVFLVRHGETEWSISGQHTGSTDIPLTKHGESQILGTAKIVYGPGRLIDPTCLKKIIVSPRVRAQRTYEILTSVNSSSGAKPGYEVVTSDAIKEWEYGRYEGLKTAEIKKDRQDRGLDKNHSWSIWRDGCEGGESPDQVTARIDGVIKEILATHTKALADDTKADILIVAHGHILRCFAKRWLKLDLQTPIGFMLEPGGVGVMSYEHYSIEERGVLLGIAFP